MALRLRFPSVSDGRGIFSFAKAPLWEGRKSPTLRPGGVHAPCLVAAADDEVREFIGAENIYRVSGLGTDGLMSAAMDLVPLSTPVLCS